MSLFVFHRHRMREHPLGTLVAVIVSIACLCPFAVHAAQAKKLRLAFSALAAANPPFWIAHELKLFEKYRLDSELVYVGGSRPIQAMLGGSIDVSQVGGAATVAAIAQGAEVAILGTVFTRLTFAIHAGPQIKQISDLRGSPEVLAGLAQGRFQAGVLTPPTTTMATRMGFREIFDLASLEFPFPVISVVSTRKYIDANPEVIRNILRATAEAIYLYKTQPELTLPVVAKYMRVSKDDPALRQSQGSFGKHMKQNLTPSLDGIKFILDFLAEQRPALKAKNPPDFVDLRFVRELEEEGFFKRFAAK